ncbi:MAG: NAD(P)H-binding protein [Myxococcales bacterium]|nr:NAD(P)H-binding protein [Myxococcales bacterium]
MARIIVLGAAGALGKHVAAQAVALGHDVTVMVRTPAKLPVGWRDRVRVHAADIAALTPGALTAALAEHDAVINTAGQVTAGAGFVALVAHVVASLEGVAPARRPVAWFLAGASVLDLGATGVRGNDLPLVKRGFWPHEANWRRLEASSLDWRLLCPGPMLEGPALGADAIHVAADRLPITPARPPRALRVPAFLAALPAMTVPYADAAAVMLANLAPGGALSRRRVAITRRAGAS